MVQETSWFCKIVKKIFILLDFILVSARISKSNLKLILLQQLVHWFAVKIFVCAFSVIYCDHQDHHSHLYMYMYLVYYELKA